MNILHIVAGELSEGASRGAYWLHKGLLSLGCESRILTNSSIDYNDGRVFSIGKSLWGRFSGFFRTLPDILLPRLYPGYRGKLFSTSLIGFDFTKHPQYHSADIIHLHWINGGLLNIKHLMKVTKPIVWTMRDMWPMTGGCHVPLDCDNFTTGCGNCVQLGSKRKLDLSRVLLLRKAKYIPKSIKLVGISSWISNMARSSYLFRNFDIRTINNNINSEDFFRVDKMLAKQLLGIETHKKVILFGCSNIRDVHKGFHLFLHALRYCSPQNYFLAFFGHVDNHIIEKTGFEYKSFGYLYDSISLRLLYSMADIFISTSMMDAFGKTIAEAMACGTPSVCFDSTGPQDIVDHKINGYKAIPFDPQDLAHGIIWLTTTSNYDDICQNASDKARSRFCHKEIARQYFNLYSAILNDD